MFTADEIRRGLRIRFACGITGYKPVLQELGHLVKQPSLSTLYKHTSQYKFLPGLVNEVFEMLEMKVKELPENQRLCSLTLDEMKIEEGKRYDPSTGNTIGQVTLPEHSGIADHGVVWQLASLAGSWKQEVAYHFSPDSVDGDAFGKVTKEVIMKASSIGLHVESVTNDMGKPNIKMQN